MMDPATALSYNRTF